MNIIKGSPLMLYDRNKRGYILIGTVQGEGYDCNKDQVYYFENSNNGLWNKVSRWVNWIRSMMRRYGEKQCMHSGNLGK